MSSEIVRVGDAPVVPATEEQLTQALLDPHRMSDWFAAAVEACGPEHGASHHVRDNLVHALYGLTVELGFPMHVMGAIVTRGLIDIEADVES